MVTGIKLISQQQVINNNAMGLSGITAAQIPSQDAPMKRATASDTRRVSFDWKINRGNSRKWLRNIKRRKSIYRDQLAIIECGEHFN